MKVFVQLAFGQGGESWNARWRRGEMIGLNEPYPYGYWRAADAGTQVVYSQDREGRLGKLVRYAGRLVLGFDFVQAWRNRRGIMAADVVWTHTEAQGLAVTLLFRVLRAKRRPKLVAQSVWLIDRWAARPFYQKWLARWLLKDADVLTFHSPLNEARARVLFPGVRTEIVLFGIDNGAMRDFVPRERDGVCRVLSLGSDQHRDWGTLVAAVSGVRGETRIASGKPAAAKAAEGRSGISVVRARTNEELLALYAWADVVVVPLTENLHASGITVIEEATILGKPVIATAAGGLEAYFGPEVVCYVPAGDAGALRSAIEGVCADVERQRAMVAAAQERVRSEVNSARYVERHMELSRALLGV